MRERQLGILLVHSVEKVPVSQKTSRLRRLVLVSINWMDELCRRDAFRAEQSCRLSQ